MAAVPQQQVVSFPEETATGVVFVCDIVCVCVCVRRHTNNALSLPGYTVDPGDQCLLDRACAHVGQSRSNATSNIFGLTLTYQVASQFRSGVGASADTESSPTSGVTQTVKSIIMYAHDELMRRIRCSDVCMRYVCACVRCLWVGGGGLGPRRCCPQPLHHLPYPPPTHHTQGLHARRLSSGASLWRRSCARL
jgi:hypothetical protein